MLLCCLGMSLLLPMLGQAQSKDVNDLRSSFTGRVVIDGENVAPSQARVDLRMVSENWSASATTDGQGDFRVEGIPSGMYIVAVNVPGCAPFEQTLRVDSSSAPLLVRLRRNGTAPASDGAASVSTRELSIPEKARKSFDKGNRLLAGNDAAGSISEFQHAIKTFPDYYEAYYKIGVAELQQEHGAQAEAAFRKSVELSQGRYALALSGLSLVLCVEQRFADAEAAARQALQIDANEATAHYALALVAFFTGRSSDAEKYAREAMRCKPKFTEAYLLLAQIHQRQNNPAAVVEDLDAYLQIDPNSPRAARARAVREQAQSALLQQAAGSAVAKANP